MLCTIVVSQANDGDGDSDSSAIFSFLPSPRPRVFSLVHLPLSGVVVIVSKYKLYFRVLCVDYECREEEDDESNRRRPNAKRQVVIASRACVDASLIVHPGKKEEEIVCLRRACSQRRLLALDAYMIVMDLPEYVCLPLLVSNKNLLYS